MNFNKIELDVIKFWNDSNLRNKLLESRKDSPQWEFLDGPPFVNGTPHMGHLLVSSIKDTFARYMSQKGYNISYMIGFDCHGLPLEQEAEKKVGKVSPNDSIERLTEFNDSCREIINSCSDVWYQQLGRLGRMFDKEQTYYTSNVEFMESLWWAFNKLWKDGLIYRSKKVMPYSPQCETPLSNFEATSNYMDRYDMSVYVRFNVKDSDEKLLIWTTTPWSLYANQGICVNSELEYSLVQVTINDITEKLWVASDIVPTLFVGDKSDHIVLTKKMGKELVGLEYIPLLTPHNMMYRVYGDSYVKADSGTGLVHLAPLFGNDDMRVMKLNNYTDNMLPEHLIDSKCNFTFEPYKGRFVIDCSTDIVIQLKKSGYAFKSEKIKHSYPHCWRTDCPLIYLATDAWFMSVTKIIPDILENNKKIEWVPSHVGTDRFANWIKDAPDWCLSRNRVWGTPIPIWSNDNGDMICVGSRQELEELTGKQFSDLHLDKLDNVEFVKNGTLYKRTFGVLDCWFESGMAGLARYGFPNCIGKSYPVDFIAESLDQTRGWFYTLNVLSTALCKEPAFKKVVVSGLILAADGKKMSKRLQNYTSPEQIIDMFGADILRLYLIGSPAAKAESFCFKDSDLYDINKKMLPYYHSHLFMSECMVFARQQGIDFNVLKSTNTLDQWIENKFVEFAKQVYRYMEKLELTYIPNLIFKFIDTLCNTYIKLSRERMKGQYCAEPLTTLYNIQNMFNLLLAPFVPHLAEHLNMMNSKLIDCNDYQSIHLKTINIQEIMDYQLHHKLLNGFCSVNELIETVRNMRQKIGKPLYFPVNSIEIYTNELNVNEFMVPICRELNVKELHVFPTNDIKKCYKPNRSVLGKIYKKEASKYVEMIENGNIDNMDISCYTVEYKVEDKPDMMRAEFSFIDNNGRREHAIVYMSTNVTEDNMMEAEINNIRRQVNNIRKEMGLKIFNKVQIVFENNDYWNNIKEIFLSTLKQRLIADVKFVDMIEEYKEITTYNGKTLKVSLKM
jgi:isoleucyl-tRNA synthetase